MSIILYLGFLIIGLYLVLRNLLPEILKTNYPRSSSKPSPIGLAQSDTIDNRIEKLETFICEKNKNIQFLQSELRIFLIQVREFDKIKTLLDDEIQRLREQ